MKVVNPAYKSPQDLSFRIFTSSSPMKSTIIVRYTDSAEGTERLEDLELPLSLNFERDDVNKLVNTAWLKLVIRSKSKAAERRRLRLIYNGRVLNELTNFKSDVFEPKLRQMRALGDSGETLVIYIHCLVGDELTPEQLAKERELDNKPQEVSTEPQVVGFDRLFLQGFSQEDVNDLRHQFHLIYLPGVLENTRNSDVNDLEEEEGRQELIRQLEERWIESTVNNQHPSALEPEDDANGVIVPVSAAAGASAELEEANRNEHLLIGILIGFFLGVLAVIFLLMDDSMFNGRHKMSIVGGIFLNFCFAIMRGQWI